MTAKYWLDLFTWTTWKEFMAEGGEISGFRERRWSTVKRMKPGDILLCYMTGLSRYFAILEITGKPYKDTSPIWHEDAFPSRVPVKVILSLPPEHAIPVTHLRDQLSFFQNMRTPHSWSGHFRGCPIEERPEDAQAIIIALEEAQRNPIYREFDPRKLERKANIYESKAGSVSIPDKEDEVEDADISQFEAGTDTSHEEIQWLLLYLGEQMGLDLWVAQNDRGKSFAGNAFRDLSRLRSSLPVQFDPATNRTIELIDVLWLRGNTIVAAFEIEHTTAIYSGLLRMADLVTMQPNISIPLYIVAPDERREKVQRETNRPIFSRALEQPLPEICQFIPYSPLKAKVQQAEEGGFLPYLRPEFLDEIAESVVLEDL